jgi:hypothetical protein
MKHFLAILLISCSTILSAQTTAIPDANFEQALINLGLDVAMDGQVLTASIDTVTFLNVGGENISDLTGIEDFIALTSLLCINNQLTSLDVTQNTGLLYLVCYSNQLTSLNVTQNTGLLTLACDGNQLSSLDITQNTVLVIVHCGLNQLTCLNAKNGNNVNFTQFTTPNNPNLTCIEVDNVAYSTTNWTNIDAQHTFSTNCPNPCIVGIDELSSATIMIHPNPTTGNLSISLEEAKTGVLRVLNSLGQLVMKQEFNNTQELDIILNGPAGLYFLQVESDGQVITKKVVKE